MPFTRTIRAASLVAVAITVAAPPAAAHDGHAYPAAPGYDRAAWDQARADWLSECRANRSGGRNAGKIGGAVVGGVVGGILGSAVAGRGDKTLGTVAGAAVGAVAGGALGASADRQAERRSLDWCESYLERHMAGSYGYGQPGYGTAYGYQPMTVMVPVMMAQAPVAAAPPQPRECTETQVIEEDVPVPAARRVIPPRARPVPAKRVPDKRIPIG